MAISLTNFFVLLRGQDDDPIRRISLERSIQYQLCETFSEAKSDLKNSDMQEREFDGYYKPDESEVLFIDNFEIPKEIINAINEPSSVQTLQFDKNDFPPIKAIFTGDFDNDPWISFQVFERRQYLSRKGISLILGDRSFRKLDEPGLNVREDITILYENDRIYFRSYHYAKRILDLSEFYREATNTELEDFAANDPIFIADVEDFQQTADTWIRRKVAAIGDKRILEISSAKRIKNEANKFGLQLNSISDKSGNACIELPPDKGELKEVLRFLDEDLYEGIFTHNQYISNSKTTH